MRIFLAAKAKNDTLQETNESASERRKNSLSESEDKCKPIKSAVKILVLDFQSTKGPTKSLYEASVVLSAAFQLNC